MTYPVRTGSTLALAAAALALAAPAGAKTVDSWDVTGGAKSCTMLSTFEDDISIGLVATPGGGLAFMASGDSLAAYGSPGDKVALDLTFAGKAPHTDWADEAAPVVPYVGNEVAVIADWGPSLARELADTVTASPSVTVRVGGKVIGTYDLSGSPAAYRELGRCGQQLAAK